MCGLYHSTLPRHQLVPSNLFLPAGVEEVEKTDDVAVIQTSHDLQLPVLEALVLGTEGEAGGQMKTSPYLKNLLDGHHLPSLAQLGLVDHPEAAIADHL